MTSSTASVTAYAASRPSSAEPAPSAYAAPDQSGSSALGRARYCGSCRQGGREARPKRKWRTKQPHQALKPLKVRPLVLRHLSQKGPLRRVPQHRALALVDAHCGSFARVVHAKHGVDDAPARGA